MLLTTVTLILSTGVRDKAAVSSLVPALLPLTTSSALVLLEAVFRLDKVVVHAPLILDLTTASGSIPVPATTVTMKMPTLTLDSPVSKTSEDLLKLSVSPVLLTVRALDLKPLSASSIPAVDLAAAPSLLLTLMVVRLLSAARRVMLVLLDTPVSLTAPTPLNTAAPSVRRSAPVVAWVEVAVTLVSALVTRVTRVRTVLSLPN